MENKIRNTMNDIYFGKTKDIVNGLRTLDRQDSHQKEMFKSELSSALKSRNFSKE